MSATLATIFDLQAEIDAAVVAEREAKAKAKQEKERENREDFEKEICWFQGTLKDLIGEDVLAALNLRYNTWEFGEERPECAAHFEFTGYSGLTLSVKVRHLTCWEYDDEDMWVIRYFVFCGDCEIDCDPPDRDSIVNENQKRYRPEFLRFLATLQSPEFAATVQSYKTELNRWESRIAETTSEPENDPEPEPEEPPMTRRDWFAAAALTGLLASEGEDNLTGEILASRRAYSYADEMIAQSQAGETVKDFVFWVRSQEPEARVSVTVQARDHGQALIQMQALDPTLLDWQWERTEEEGLIPPFFSYKLQCDPT